MSTDALRDKLIAKALKLLDECEDKDRVEVFKAVSTFYLGSVKGVPKKEQPNKSGFGAVIEKLNGGAPATHGADA
jgi:hypothetical protein